MLLINRDKMRMCAAEIGIELDAVALERLDLYAEMLVNWNEKFNLTAITEPDDIIVKHFADSLHAAVHIRPGCSVIDVGTGAGFPGIVIAIHDDSRKLTLLDSIGKRVDFLEHVCERLGIEAELVYERAEVAAQMQQFRERYDVATARAVAPLNVISEYCMPFVRVGGTMTVMCGRGYLIEIERATNAVKLLGGDVLCAEKYVLSDQSERAIVKSVKQLSTAGEYPRTGAKIKKHPL